MAYSYCPACSHETEPPALVDALRGFKECPGCGKHNPLADFEFIEVASRILRRLQKLEKAQKPVEPAKPVATSSLPRPISESITRLVIDTIYATEDAAPRVTFPRPSREAIKQRVARCRQSLEDEICRCLTLAQQQSKGRGPQ